MTTIRTRTTTTFDDMMMMMMNGYYHNSLYPAGVCKNFLLFFHFPLYQNFFVVVVLATFTVSVPPFIDFACYLYYHDFVLLLLSFMDLVPSRCIFTYQLCSS